MDLEICNVSLAYFIESSTSSAGSELQEDFLSSSFMGGKQVWVAIWGLKHEFASLFTGAHYIR